MTFGLIKPSIWELPPREQASKLAEWLDDADEGRADAGAVNLFDLGPGAEPAIPALLRALRSRRPPNYCSCTTLDGGEFLPRHARWALTRIGPAAESGLKEALQDRDPLARVHAAGALWEISRRTDLAVPALLRALKDRKASERNAWVGIEAALALQMIGQENKTAVLPGLLDALMQGLEPCPHMYAVEAVKHLDPKAAAKFAPK
jgi:hypothetical protein